MSNFLFPDLSKLIGWWVVGLRHTKFSGENFKESIEKVHGLYYMLCLNLIIQSSLSSFINSVDAFAKFEALNRKNSSYLSICLRFSSIGMNCSLNRSSFTSYSFKYFLECSHLLTTSMVFSKRMDSHE